VARIREQGAAQWRGSFQKAHNNRPILKLGSSVGESLKVRWIGPHFFFSFELSYYKDP
jgi:hypothetical protein